MEKKFRLNSIGVGAEKCGTTWLANMMEAHPEICFIDRKDTGFLYAPVFDIKEYEKHFIGDGVKCDWSVAYLPDPNVAKRIKEFFPDVKIIVALRNPINRIVSAYNYHKYWTFVIKAETLEEAIKKYPDKYIGRSSYYKQLKVYYDLFPKEQIKVVLMEDIKNNSKKVLKELYAFVGVNPDFIPKDIFKRSNVARKRKYKSFKLILQNAYVPSIKYLKEKVPTFIRLIKFFGFGKISSIVEYIDGQNVTSLEKEKIKDETRAMLLKILLPDIEKTEKLIGRDLSAWKKS